MMTALQILDRVAFCIGYAVIGGAILVAAFGLAFVFIRVGFERDKEKRMDD